MPDQQLSALAAAVALAAAHLLAGRMRLLGGVPRSAWLSAFAGVSVAYVFAHLLPELGEGQERLSEAAGLRFLEDHVYLMSLLGLAVFYGVEQHSQAARRRGRERAGPDRTSSAAFKLSIAAFAVYNAVVGYLLLRGELEDLIPLGLYTAAMGVHFVVNDFALREHHKEAYDRIGRHLLAVAVLAGWLIGVSSEVSERVIDLVIAFIGGGVILNVLKEELPGDRQARVLPFVLGAVGYAALLQLV